jgi:23S rRNA (pseudouridine1915-N3)-methyltransferase
VKSVNDFEGQPMKIRLLTVGRIENESIQTTADMYRNRIDHYAVINWEIVKPERSKSLSVPEILMREGRRIVQKLESKDYTILLDRAGSQSSSEEFASSLERFMQSAKRVTFIIGGPWGVAETIKRQAAELLSLSKMTLPHELAAVVLLEQLYRAFSILKGEKYHK